MLVSGDLVVPGNWIGVPSQGARPGVELGELTRGELGIGKRPGVTVGELVLGIGTGPGTALVGDELGELVLAGSGAEIGAETAPGSSP